MRKQILKSLLLAIAGVGLMAGSALAVPLPAEYEEVFPSAITTATDISAQFGYSIWTSDPARLSWHIRWNDGDPTASNPFNGTISLENNIGVFSTFNFEFGDVAFDTPESAFWITFTAFDADGLDFFIIPTASPSFVGFDLFYRGTEVGPDGITPLENYIYLGTETVASLTGDQDFKVAAPVSPVPEPATMLLFGAGVVGLIGARRRNKK